MRLQLNLYLVHHLIILHFDMYQEICFTDKTTKHIIMFKSGGKLFHTAISSFIDYVKLNV